MSSIVIFNRVEKLIFVVWVGVILVLIGSLVVEVW